MMPALKCGLALTWQLQEAVSATGGRVKCGLSPGGRRGFFLILAVRLRN
jgi:hypothetical protein